MTIQATRLCQRGEDYLTSKAHDPATLDFYEVEAPDYVASGPDGASSLLSGFLDELPATAHILELGCGGGRDTKAMLDRGFHVDATDGSAALAAKAMQRAGQKVRVMRFEDIDALATYDAVWAHACLLHVPRSRLVDILAKIHNTLVPSGLFFANYKAGEHEGRDKFGRYFNYPSSEWLARTYDTAAHWDSVEITQQQGSGFDKVPTKWLNVYAAKGSK